MNPANGFWAYIHRKYYPLKHWRHITIMILNSQFYFFFISKQTFIKLLYSAKVLSFSELMGKFFSYFSLSCLQNIVEEEKRLYQNRILFFFSRVWTWKKFCCSLSLRVNCYGMAKKKEENNNCNMIVYSVDCYFFFT